MSENGSPQRKALVTGGGSGIGEAICHRFAQDGMQVTVADVDADAAERVARAVGGTPWPVDLSDLGALESLQLDCDVLVNNAGIQRVRPIQEFPPEEMQLMVRLMLESPFLLVRAALPHMYQKGWGRIINISSAHGLRASAFKSVYVMCKHGLEGLSKTTALEGGEHGVTSNCINPSYVETPLVSKQIADQALRHGIPEDEVVAKVMLTENAIKRLVQPDEVAALAGFLASDAAGMCTGGSFTIDGGWTSH